MKKRLVVLFLLIVFCSVIVVNCIGDSDDCWIEKRLKAPEKELCDGHPNQPCDTFKVVDVLVCASKSSNRVPTLISTHHIDRTDYTLSIYEDDELVLNEPCCVVGNKESYDKNNNKVSFHTIQEAHDNCKYNVITIFSESKLNSDETIVIKRDDILIQFMVVSQPKKIFHIKSNNVHIYGLPKGNKAGDEDRVILDKGHTLIMSEYYLVTSYHNNHPRVVHGNVHEIVHRDDFGKEKRRLNVICQDPDDTCPPTRLDWEERLEEKPWVKNKIKELNKKRKSLRDGLLLGILEQSQKNDLHPLLTITFFMYSLITKLFPLITYCVFLFLISIIPYVITILFSRCRTQFKDKTPNQTKKRKESIKKRKKRRTRKKSKKNESNDFFSSNNSKSVQQNNLQNISDDKIDDKTSKNDISHEDKVLHTPAHQTIKIKKNCS